MIIFLTKLITKLITKVMNLLGYGATTLPGRIALFFKRDILAKLSQGVTSNASSPRGKYCACVF